MFRRARIRRTRRGTYKVDLPEHERDVLAHLLPQLRTLIEEVDPTDERVRRLYPPTYLDDPEAEAELTRLMHSDLVSSRLAALDAMEATLRLDELDADQVTGWISSVNQIRLVLGTLLDVSEEHDVSRIPDDDPQIEQHALYAYLGFLLEELVQAVSGG